MVDTSHAVYFIVATHECFTCHQLPSEFTAGITEYEQLVYKSSTNKCQSVIVTSVLVTRVKSSYKDINTQAIIQGSKVASYYFKGKFMYIILLT